MIFSVNLIKAFVRQQAASEGSFSEAEKLKKMFQHYCKADIEKWSVN
jgi:hypothetical protein